LDGLAFSPLKEQAILHNHMDEQKMDGEVVETGAEETAAEAAPETGAEEAAA